MNGLVKKLLTFLVILVIVALIVYAIRLVLPFLGLPPVVDIIILIVIAIVILVAIAKYFGLLDGGGP